MTEIIELIYIVNIYRIENDSTYKKGGKIDSGYSFHCVRSIIYLRISV